MADDITNSLNAARGLTPRIGNLAKASTPTAHAKAAVTVVEINDEFSREVGLRFAFIGAGQGGGKLAQSFWNLGYRRICAFNTTSTDFAGLAPDMRRLSLNIGGAAKDMNLARNALRTRDQDVRDLLSRSWGDKIDCAFICVGLGGGTGSGTALPLVQAARKYLSDCGLPPRVGVIAAMPGPEEGQRVARNAVLAFNELYEAKVSPLILIDNEQVDKLYRPAMSQLLNKSNELVSTLLDLFNQLSAVKSPLFTFDSSELAQILDSGIVVMGSVDFQLDQINHPSDISQGIREQLTRNVLATVDIGSGRVATCVFVASQEVLDRFGREYFAEGYSSLNRLMSADNSVLHRGLYPDGEAGLQCYTMIGGLTPPRGKLETLAKQAGLAGETSTMASFLKVQ